MDAGIDVFEPITPEETVVAFYSWYLREYEEGPEVGPLVSEAYQESPYLSREFVRYVEEEFDEDCPEYDPILLSDQIPVYFTAEVLVESDEETAVEVSFGDSEDELLFSRRVVLQLGDDDRWEITDIGLCEE